MASSPNSFRAERQLILISAGTTARRREMREQALMLAREVDKRRLVATLRERRLLPLLGPRLLEMTEESPDAPLAAAVQESLASGRRHGAVLEMLSTRISTMLAEVGIRSAALKGPGMSEELYGDPGRRTSSDVDLLVAPDQLRRAAEIVRSLGYRAPSDPLQRSGLPLLHFVLVHETARLPAVELHWRIHWYESAFASERLLPKTNDETAWRPAAADQLAALLLFYARDGFIDLRLATDLGAWWDVRGAELPPGAVDALMNAYPALARAIPAALSAARQIVGLPADRVIEHQPRLGLRELAAARLCNPHPDTSSSQLYADMGLIDGLLSPPGGFSAFVRRQVLPPPAVRRQHARDASRSRVRSPLSRSAGILARYGRTLTRLARAPETLADHGASRRRVQLP